jgi:hypothetical protein
VVPASWERWARGLVLDHPEGMCMECDAAWTLGRVCGYVRNVLDHLLISSASSVVNWHPLGTDMPTQFRLGLADREGAGAKGWPRTGSGGCESFFRLRNHFGSLPHGRADVVLRLESSGDEALRQLTRIESAGRTCPLFNPVSADGEDHLDNHATRLTGPGQNNTRGWLGRTRPESKRQENHSQSTQAAVRTGGELSVDK